MYKSLTTSEKVFGVLSVRDDERGGHSWYDGLQKQWNAMAFKGGGKQDPTYGMQYSERRI